MSEVDAESAVSRYYRLLTIAPGKRATSLILLAVVLTVYALATSLPAKSLEVYAESASLYALEALLLVLLLMPLRRTRVFNLKRLVNLATSLLLVTLPTEVVLSRLGDLRGVGISAGSGLAFFILSGISGLGIALPFSVLPAILVPLVGGLALGYEPQRLLSSAVFLSLASLAVGALSLYSIERLGRNRGVSPLGSARAFLKTWLTGDHKHLEEMMRSLGVTDRVRVGVLVFRREQDKPVALVFPDIHFGPFRNVGSARFPYFLEESLGHTVEAFVFHTPGSHERNLTTSSESYEKARAVASSIVSYYGQLVGYGMCRPSVLRDGEWEAYVLRGPTASVCFLTNTLRGSDDLPHGVWRKVEEAFGERRGLNLVVAVDSHSAKGPRIGSEEELSGLVEKLRGADECREEEVYVGYGEAVGTGCRELCHDKVKALTIRFSDGERYAIVYLYGNNVDIRAREEIVSRLERMGYKNPLVVTPDDHSCAATFKEKPYYVVSDCPSLYEAIARAVERAAESETRADYVTIEHVFHDAELAGQNLWKLASLIDDLGGTALRLFLAVSVSVNLLALPLVLSL